MLNKDVHGTNYPSLHLLPCFQSKLWLSDIISLRVITLPGPEDDFAGQVAEAFA